MIVIFFYIFLVLTPAILFLGGFKSIKGLSILKLLKIDNFDFSKSFIAWKKVAKLSVSEIKFLIGAVVTSLLLSYCNYLQPELIGRAIDITTKTLTSQTKDSSTSGTSKPFSPIDIFSFFHISSNLQVIFGKIMLVELCRVLFEYTHKYFSNSIGDHVRQRAQELYFKQVIYSEIAYLDQTHTSILNRCYTNLDHIHFIAGHQIPQMIRNIFTLLSVSLYLLQTNWMMGICVILFTIIKAIIEKMFHQELDLSWDNMMTVHKKCNKLREESFSTMRVIKSFSVEKYIYQTFVHYLQEDQQLRQKLVHAGATNSSVMMILNAIMSTYIWCIGLNNVIYGYSTIGDISVFSILVNKLADSANGIFNTLRETLRTTKNLQQSWDIIEREIQIHNNEETGYTVNSREAFHGLVEFKNVNFAYPSRLQSIVLHDINLKLKPGQVTALCGSSGGGKSSIAQLLLRLYDVTQGEILIDGVNVKEWNLPHLHEYMSIVPQEPTLFDGTICENIIFGHQEIHANKLNTLNKTTSTHITPATTDKDTNTSDNNKEDNSVKEEEDLVIQASKIANAHDFIITLPEGYQTKIGEKGVKLSGGQKQRIAIARAVLLDPKILILDEATSSLDTESERVVQAALDTVMKGRTTLVIAHRLSTIRHADNIIVIHEGKIVEEGTHDELVQKEHSRYKELLGMSQS